MADYCLVTLLGRLTNDPESREAGKSSVATFGMCVNNSYKKGDKTVDEPMFITIECWGRTGEIACEYLSKGTPVMIEGRLKFQQWEKDGVKKSRHLISCQKLILLGKKSDGPPPRDDDGPPVEERGEAF
jgi:single-strand DNA-binding protein